MSTKKIEQPRFDFNTLIGSPCPKRPTNECQGCVQVGDGAVYACDIKTRILGVFCKKSNIFRPVESGVPEPSVGNKSIKIVVY